GGRAFDLRIDFRNVSPFLRRVLAAAASVPPGQVVSYGEIARSIGQPRSSRAVGQALRRNPMPIILPCHRVIAAGGKIGGYGGGGWHAPGVLPVCRGAAGGGGGARGAGRAPLPLVGRGGRPTAGRALPAGRGWGGGRVRP